MHQNIWKEKIEKRFPKPKKLNFEYGIVPYIESLVNDDVAFKSEIEDKLNHEKDDLMQVWEDEREDLECLLKLNYDKFMAELVYCDGIQLFIQSVFQGMKRNYDVDEWKRGKERNVKEAIYKYTFLVVWRTLFANEKNLSDKKVIDEFIAKFIRMYVFPHAAQFLDFCALYGNSNPKMVSQYLHELVLMEPEIIDDFALLFQKEIPNALNKEVVNTREAFSNEALDVLLEQLDYFYDMSFTLRTFFQRFPLGALVSMEPTTENDSLKATMFHQLVAIFEVCLPLISQKISEDDALSNFKVEQTKQNILSIVHIQLKELFLDPIFDIGASYSDSAVVPSVILMNRFFESGNSVSQDDLLQRIENIRNRIPYLKGMFDNREYKKGCIDFLLAIFMFTSLNVDATFTPEETSEVVPGLFLTEYSHYFNLTGLFSQMLSSADSTCQESIRTLDDIVRGLQSQLKEKVSPRIHEFTDPALSQLKLLYPKYGEGFLKECLDHYENNITKATAALSKDSLPPQLRNLDRNTPMNMLPRPVFSAQTPTPSTLLSSPNWDEVNIFLGPQKEELGTIGKDLQERIIENFTYDDEYDDSELDGLHTYETETSDLENQINRISDEKILPDNPNHQKSPKAFKPPQTESNNSQGRGRGRGRRGKKSARYASKKRMTSLHGT